MEPHFDYLTNHEQAEIRKQVAVIVGCEVERENAECAGWSTHAAGCVQKMESETIELLNLVNGIIATALNES